MKVEVEDVLFWMDAIRNSDDRYRTLESFWKGQVRSKVWLIEQLAKEIDKSKQRIVIHGGWNGVLSSLLFNSSINIDHITSIDIDSYCEEIATTINKRQEIEGRFSAVTSDMCDFENYEADIVINTSCEHITDEQIKKWFKNIPVGAFVVMQSNNYFDLDEHINCVNSAEELAAKVPIKSKTYKFETPKYTRFMIIGKKFNV